MTAPGEPIRIAVIGTGYGAKTALPVYQELNSFEPVAVWSRDAARARAVADAAAVPVAGTDLDRVLATPGLEAVHVATPVALHGPVAVAAARRGLHVLCEKPLARNLEEARAIQTAIANAGVVGAVNLGRRLHETRARVIDRVREVVGSPRMVSLSLVRSDHAESSSRAHGWVHEAGMGGGRLQAFGAHDIDLLLEMCGDVEAVAAATAVTVPMRDDPAGRPRPVTAEDTYVAVMRLSNGGLAQVSLVATARHARGDVVEVLGSTGTVRLDAERRVWWSRTGGELQCDGPLAADGRRAFALVAESFACAIRDGAPPHPSLEDGLRVQAVLDAIRIAATAGRWVVPEPI